MIARRWAFRQFARLVVVMVVAAGALGDRPVAAQEGVPAGHDSVGEAVRITSESTVLSGNLFTPPGPGPHPAVVVLMGSGSASYRDSWGPEFFPFWKEITEFLIEHGFAVLLFDKPGVGESTGDWRRQSFDRRADNALAAVRHLGSRDDIDASRIGLVGHSQGGWIAQIAGARAPDQVAFLILLAGPASSVRRQIRDDMESQWVCSGVSRAGLAARRSVVHVGLGLMSLTSRLAKPGYLSRIIQHDPRRDLSEIRQPTLALFAEHDPLVPPGGNMPPLERFFGTSHGNSRLVTMTVPGADHFFRPSTPCPTGRRPAGWAPGFFESLENPDFWQWIPEPKSDNQRGSR